jgi:sortase A
MNYRKVVLGSLLISIIYLIPAHFTSSTNEPGTIINHVEAAGPATPTYLTIPNAKVSTNIINVGITPEGNLDVPGNYTEVGWYKYGTRPGEVGSAVLDGHVDNGGSTPGPFKHLRDLKIGDDIYVTMSSGKILHYKVTVSDAYPLNKFPGEMVFHQTGDKYLKIITCHGKFVPSLKTYNERLIVTAVLAE